MYRSDFDSDHPVQLLDVQVAQGYLDMRFQIDLRSGPRCEAYFSGRQREYR